MWKINDTLKSDDSNDWKANERRLMFDLNKLLTNCPNGRFWRKCSLTKMSLLYSKLLWLFESVSLLISQKTLNLQGSVPARIRQMAFTCTCSSRLWRRQRNFIEHLRMITSVSFLSRERRSWKYTCILHLKPFVIHFSRCRSHFRFEEGEGGKVPYESSFVCVRYANFWDDP